jgi:hypothetical protein
MLRDLIHPANAFGLHGLPVRAKLLGQNGNLQTFVAHFGGRYATKEMLLQRIYLWTPIGAEDPSSRAERRETAAVDEGMIQDQGILEPCPVNLVLAKNGKPYWYDSLKSEFWRCYSLGEGIHADRLPGTPDMACQAARILWQYHETLSGLPETLLLDSIGDFVSTRQSLGDLHRAALEDPLGRSAGCLRELRFASDYVRYAPHALAFGGDEGGEGKRQPHGNGIHLIMPLHAGKGICPANLKTAFPDHYPYRQLGSIRKTVSDDPPGDPRNERGESVIFAARLAEGFLGVIKGLLLPNEFNQLVFSGTHLAYELGIRFLSDHILGDRRFPADFPARNLIRARQQFRLAYRIDTHAADLVRLNRDLELI